MLFKKNSKKLLYCVIAILTCFEFTGCGSHEKNLSHDSINLENKQDNFKDSSILIPAESFYSDYFPCNDCHNELQPNKQRRELVEMHDDIVFDHDSENRWCLACHSADNRDSLVLAGGKLLGFDESYKLCGQCHGPKLRDWKMGIHGKRTGYWNGTKEYRLCANCHDPHSPKIKSISPLPAPLRPEQISVDSIRKEEYEKE